MKVDEGLQNVEKLVNLGDIFINGNILCLIEHISENLVTRH